MTLKIFTESFQERFNDAVAIWENITGETLKDAAPERIIIQVLCSMLQNAGINHNIAFKENFLQNMSNNQLDAYGDQINLPRRATTPAVSNVRLDFSTSFPSGLTIGQTIFSNTSFVGENENGSFTFRTTEEYFAPAGTTEIIVAVEEFFIDGSGNINNNGSLGNDCIITALSDPNQYDFVDSAESTINSYGGLDQEPDDNYRIRLLEANNKYSTAGTAEAYKFFAKEVDTDIIDVALTKNGWKINIWILPINFDPLSSYATLIAKVNEAFNPVSGNSLIRPINDVVLINTPAVKTYTINSINIVVYDEKNVETIRTRSLKAIDMFVNGNKSKLGQDVIESQLIAALSGNGIKQVSVNLSGLTNGVLVVGNNEIAALSVDFNPANLTVTGAPEI